MSLDDYLNSRMITTPLHPAGECLAQARLTKGLHVVAVADLNIERARSQLEIAGWPVRLNHTVNGEKAKTRRQYSSTSSSIMSIQPSLGGSVPSPGVSRTS